MYIRITVEIWNAGEKKRKAWGTSNISADDLDAMYMAVTKKVPISICKRASVVNWDGDVDERIAHLAFIKFAAAYDYWMRQKDVNLRRKLNERDGTR